MRRHEYNITGGYKIGFQGNNYYSRKKYISKNNKVIKCKTSFVDTFLNFFKEAVSKW